MSGDEYRPWELVSDPTYFRGIIGNFVALGFGPNRGKSAHVRFGLTGNGYAPNYQIEGPDGIKHCFNGLGHGEAPNVEDEFEADRVSTEQFDFRAIQEMLDRID